jgi:hypothetical protein
MLCPLLVFLLAAAGPLLRLALACLLTKTKQVAPSRLACLSACRNVELCFLKNSKIPKPTPVLLTSVPHTGNLGMERSDGNLHRQAPIWQGGKQRIFINRYL